MAETEFGSQMSERDSRFQEGARKACAARSEEGEEIRRGEEVVVTRFDQGVAYVRRWSELAEKAGVMPAEEGKSL